jgi:hypothetical protein
MAAQRKFYIDRVAFDSVDVSDWQLDQILSAPELAVYMKEKPDHVVQEFKSFLREVLLSRITFFHSSTGGILSPRTDPTEWIEETRLNSAKYLRSGWMHNPWLTRYLIKELLTCHLEGLTYLSSAGFYPEYGFRALQQPYSTILSPVAGVAFLLGLLGLTFYLLSRDWLVWASLVAIYIVYHYALKARQVFARAKMKAKFASQIEALSVIQYEVSTELSYDPDTVMRRLEFLETKGFLLSAPYFPRSE